MKSIDPSRPTLRKNAIIIAKIAIKSLLEHYPMVSFHQDTQRLAIGTIEASIIVYDLRTAQKWRILEGHTAPLSVISFSSDGSTLVSYSYQESSVKVWKTGNTGFFSGLFDVQGKCMETIPVPHATRESKLPDIFNNCKMEVYIYLFIINV